MPKLNFEIMIINNNKYASDTKLSLDTLQGWFSGTKISFIENDSSYDVKFKSDDGDINFDFEIIEHESDNGPSSYIVTFKSLTNIYKKKIFLYDNFLTELKIVLNKNYCLSYSLNRELSKYYSRQLYTVFHDFEVGLRRFMHLIFFKTFGPKWDEKIIPKELKNSVVYRFDNHISDHIIEEFELAAIENLLFKPIFIEKIDTEEKKYISPLQNIGSYDKPEYAIPIDFVLNSTSNYTAFSLWDRYFSQYVRYRFKGEKFIESFKKIRQIRNKVAHNKKITNKDYIEANNFLKAFQVELKRISNSILAPDQQESVDSNFASALQINSQMIEAIKAYLLPTIQVPEITEIIKNINYPNTQIDKTIKNINKPYEEFKNTVQAVTTPLEETMSSVKNALDIYEQANVLPKMKEGLDQ
ncbi:hypothetical protein [Lactococcus petauri]|uniref:hypothetical protein n=1 Tax=Lactococcus petauri TaxID=1940789 RepID=UPI0017827201|nr:hypothetical protein [Lactococcus petauri]MBD5824606.1 hypothetical protein [Lactococcus petauri]